MGETQSEKWDRKFGEESLCRELISLIGINANQASPESHVLQLVGLYLRNLGTPLTF